MSDLLYIIILIAITYFTGSVIEKNHFNKIKKREKALVRYPVVNFGIKDWDPNRKIKKFQLVTGEAVISGDYFKTFAASLKNTFGGRLTSLESVMDRARREAILRMREKAYGANFIINVKIEATMVNDIYANQGGTPQCAVIAYGTAITYEK